MNLWLRLFWARISWRLRPKLSIWDVCRRPFRVWPSDLDIFNHMNNGKFLSLQDLGRFDLLMRSGAWQDWANHGWYPVVVAENITFRKSLKLFERFEIETKAVGWDDIAVYLEQRFVVKGEIYSRSIVRVRLLKRSRGIVTPAEMLEVSGHPPQPLELPKWVQDWAEQSSLPKIKEAAPSDW